MAYCDTQNNEARHHLTARDLHLMSHQSLVKTLPNLMLACHKTPDCLKHYALLLSAIAKHL